MEPDATPVHPAIHIYFLCDGAEFLSGLIGGTTPATLADCPEYTLSLVNIRMTIGSRQDFICFLLS